MFGNNNLVKAYSIRFLGCSTRDRLNISLQKITSIIWENELNLNSLEEQEEEQIENNNNNNDIEWIIERTGDLSLLPNTPIINEKEINIILEETTIPLDLNLISKEECSICYENIEINKIVKINCSHEFCVGCIKKIINSDIKKCALCRNNIDCIKVKNTEIETFLKN
jgi:hypothetical protein